MFGYQAVENLEIWWFKDLGIWESGNLLGTVGVQGRILGILRSDKLGIQGFLMIRGYLGIQG